MSGEVIKEFLVGLGFKIDEAGLQQFSSGVTSASIAVTAIGTAAVAAAGAITKFVTGIAEEFDAVSDLSNRVNATAEDILQLGYVATLTDSSVEAVASSLDRLNQVAGEAMMGMGRGKAVFEEIGISVKDSNGKLKNTSVLMSEIGEKIKDMERGQQLAVLNKLGIDPTMIGALTSDVSALKEEFDSIYKAAGINASEAAQASSDFMDSLGRLKFVMDSIGKAVGLKFMGQIKNGIDQMRKWLVENMPKIISAISPIIDLTLRIAEAFIAIVGRVAQAIGAIIGWLVKVNEATNGWAAYILAAVAAWRYLNLAFLATPIGAILSLAAAIALLIDDFMTWKEGGDSLIDWAAWENEIGLAMGIIGGFRDFLAGAFNAIFAAIDSVVSLLTGDFSSAWRAAGELVDTIAGGIKTAAGLIGLGDDTPVSVPSPQAQAAVGGANQNVSQQTEIIVQGGADPQSTARAVAGAQNRVNADMARNMRGAAR